jgi:hypothetical protein
MIQTLQRACNKQYMGVSFGPRDIKGSVISLINRGLIASHVVHQKGDYLLTWYVTPQAISMLEEVGVKVSI